MDLVIGNTGIKPSSKFCKFDFLRRNGRNLDKNHGLKTENKTKVEKRFLWFKVYDVNFATKLIGVRRFIKNRRQIDLSISIH